MDSVKNWYRSKSMNFNQDSGNRTSDFKPQSYGPTDRAMKSATDMCKKLSPSAETKTTVLNAVENAKGYGRKLIPNEATKQKVSRFYESQVAKLKYSQLKEGFHPTGRGEDLTRFCEDDSFHGISETDRRNFDQQVPTIDTLSSPAYQRTNSADGNNNNQEWNGSFMQYKEPARRGF